MRRREEWGSELLFFFILFSSPCECNCIGSGALAGEGLFFFHSQVLGIGVMGMGCNHSISLLAEAVED